MFILWFETAAWVWWIHHSCIFSLPLFSLPLFYYFYSHSSLLTSHFLFLFFPFPLLLPLHSLPLNSLYLPSCSAMFWYSNSSSLFSFTILFPCGHDLFSFRTLEFFILFFILPSPRYTVKKNAKRKIKTKKKNRTYPNLRRSHVTNRGVCALSYTFPHLFNLSIYRISGPYSDLCRHLQHHHHQRCPAQEMSRPLSPARFLIILLPGISGPLVLIVNILNDILAELRVHFGCKGFYLLTGVRMLPVVP